MKAYQDLLSSLGFVPADHKKDFGYVIPYVHYVVRKRSNIHEYVSLVTYSTDFIGREAVDQKIEWVEGLVWTDGKFCEAVYELFMAPKNPYKKGNLKESEFAKKGMTSLMGSLPRSLADLEACVNKTETEIKETTERLFNQLLLAEKKK